MDEKRYSELMMENKDKVFDLHLGALDVGLLHGAIRLTLMHPEVVDQYSAGFKIAARGLREKCLAFLAEMGFTPEEIQELDSEVV